MACSHKNSPIFQAANIQGLFSFVNADLQAFRPRPESSGFDYSEGSPSGFGSEVRPEPRFPKSLYLVHPLFGTYELSPVASGAQASVPVPEGLDLDVWIVAPPKEEREEETGDAEDAADIAKTKKGKKGKGKASAGTKSRKQKRIEQGGELEPAPEETEEERAARERVRNMV